MKFTTLLRECAEDLLDTEDTITAEKVVACARAQHPEVFHAERERLVQSAALAAVKNLLKKMGEDSGEQLHLPGVGLPTVICVPGVEPGEFDYVRSDKATWPQLAAGRKVRADHVAHAQAKLEEYDEALERLRPIMEADPTLTTADALAMLAAQS